MEGQSEAGGLPMGEIGRIEAGNPSSAPQVVGVTGSASFDSGKEAVQTNPRPELMGN
jgi:hypothetical protein